MPCTYHVGMQHVPDWTACVLILIGQLAYWMRGALLLDAGALLLDAGALLLDAGALLRGPGARLRMPAPGLPRG